MWKIICSTVGIWCFHIWCKIQAMLNISKLMKFWYPDDFLVIFHRLFTWQLESSSHYLSYFHMVFKAMVIINTLKIEFQFTDFFPQSWLDNGSALLQVMGWHQIGSNQLISPKCGNHLSVNGVSIGSDNGLLPIQHQAIILTNAGLLSNGSFKTNFIEFLIKIPNFSFTKMHLNVLSEKCQPFYPGGRWVKQLIVWTNGDLVPWYVYVSTGLDVLHVEAVAHCGLMTPYIWLVAWWHQGITWTMITD